MATHNLFEVDTFEVVAIVNDELDNISHCPSPAVKSMGSFTQVPLTDVQDPDALGGAMKQLRMDKCIPANANNGESDTKHTLLFDAGPEEEVFERNTIRLRTDLSAITINLINAAKPDDSQPVTVDVHSDRPDFRGIEVKGTPITLEADPNFEEIESAGGVLRKEDGVHTVLEDTFLISGEIPRITLNETGILGGIRLNRKVWKWVSDELIMEERFVMANLKGKGLVLFTGCNHAGVINASIHAKKLAPNLLLYAVVGGYHLADADDKKIQKTVSDFQNLGPKVLLPGHCSGWRFKNAWGIFSPGGMVPIFAGRRYEL